MTPQTQNRHRISTRLHASIVLPPLAIILMAALFAPQFAEAQAINGASYEVLYTFAGGFGDAGVPATKLLMDNPGNLYGTTEYRGSSDWGVVYKLDTNRNETLLHNFTGGADGATPNTPLIMDSDGTLYGITMQGGHSCGVLTCGVAYKIDNTGAFSLIHSFNGTDGMTLLGTLIRDSAGNIFSTAMEGGTGFGDGGFGFGNVFQLDPAGNETVLYFFAGGADGGWPRTLIRDNAENFYGVAELGGDLSSAACLPYGCGVVYKLETNGVETVLHTFTGPDGRFPFGDLILDSAGKLYGVAAGGPYCPELTTDGCGVVFKPDTTTGQYTVLHAFKGGAEGIDPAGLYMDDAGILYGTAEGGGKPCGTGTGCGVIFQLDPAAGAETVLYTFTGTADGGQPVAGLIRDAAGAFYGTASMGGTGDCGAGCGVVFKLTLSPEFSLSASAFSPDTISPGQASTATVGLASIGGFSDSGNLARSGQPSPALAPRCSITNSTNPRTSVTLTVSTTGPTATLHSNAGFGLSYASWIPLIGLVMAGVGFGSEQKRKRKVPAVLPACALVGVMVLSVACGGGGGNTGGGKSGTPGGG